MKMGKFLSKYIWGNEKPETVLENDEISEIRQIIQTRSPSGLARYIDIKKESWKKESIKFGIAGRPNTGKTSLINAISNVKDDNAGFNQEESYENISFQRKNCHLIEKQKLLFFELSSIGSENLKTYEYQSKTQLWDYDYFFIVFDTVLHEDDLWLAQQLVKMKKPFVLVRSKVDLDIKLGFGEDERSIIKSLREETFSTINKIEVLQSNIGVCFISSINEDIGEMANLKKHINHNLKSKKYETILYSLNGLPQGIIQTKYISLKKRIIFVTAAVGITSVTRLSGIEFGINIAILVWELYHYINVLGVCRKDMKTFINAEDSQVIWSEVEKTRWKLVRHILHQSPKLIALIAVAAMQNTFGIVGSIPGTVVTFALSGLIAYSFLINILDNFTHESIISYDRAVSRHVPKNTSIRSLLQLY